jgi:hypothetical protein
MPSNAIMPRVAIGAVTWTVAGTIALACVPAFAQSDTDRRTTGVVRVYTHGQTLTTPTALPPNMRVAGLFQPLVTKMLERSATFRRQCLRIARADRLDVMLTTFQGYAPARVRARARLETTRDGRLIATLEIKPLDDSAELIAHEIEHVIEWLDGVDLRARATLRASGVETDAAGTYETIRAMRIGQIVTREVQE